MNLDTNIAMGVRPAPIDFNAMNQGNVLANMAQLRSAENQNALAQYSLASAKRGDESQTALMEKAKVPGFKMTFADAIQGGPAGMAAYKAQEDAATKALERTKTQQEIDTSTFKLTQDKLKHGWMSMGEASTPQAAIEKLKDGVKKGYFDEPTALKEAQLIMGMTPDQYKQYRIEKVMGLLDAKDQLSAMLPKTVRQDTGSAITSIQDNPMLPGYGKPIAGADITKTETFADLTAAKQATTSAGQLKVAQGNAATSAGQLKLAKDKYAFELANPIKTLVEGPNQTAFGFNPLNSQMTPVINAPVTGPNAMAPAARPSTNALAAPAPAQAVAPAAAPVAKPPAAAGTAGPMGITLPANAAAAVNAPGTPFQGKAPESNSEYKKQALGIQNTNSALIKMENVLKDFSTLDMINPSKRASLGAAHATALLFAKELFNLGVLNGGDERIINSVINNPIDIASTAIPIKAIRDQVTSLKYVVEYANKNLAAVNKQPEMKLLGFGSAASSGQQMPPIYATNGNQRIVSTDGGQNWTPANN